MRRSLAAFLVAAGGFVCSPSPAMASNLPEIAAAMATATPALVVLCSPDCLVCRKSLPEIERFAATSALGFTVTTVVPMKDLEEARRLLARRAPTLRVEGDGGRLSAADARALLDRPVDLALDRHRDVAAAHAGLLGAWILEAVARRATQAGAEAASR